MSVAEPVLQGVSNSDSFVVVTSAAGMEGNASAAAAFADADTNGTDGDDGGGNVTATMPPEMVFGEAQVRDVFLFEVKAFVVVVVVVVVRGGGYMSIEKDKQVKAFIS